MPKEIQITPEDILRYELFESSLTFCRYFFKQTTKRKFIVGRHHEIIAEALDRVLKGECKRLIINIAPRYGKTQQAIKNFIAMGLAINPQAKFIHLSYSDGLALDNSEEVKDLVQDPEYQRLFPYVQIKKDSRAKEKWYTTAGGGVLARSAAGQVTGFGAGQVDPEEDELQKELQLSEDINAFINDIAGNNNLGEVEKKLKFGGAICVDDPCKPESADSDVERERVNSRFDSTIRNRVNSRNTPIIVIMQRLHPRDLAGYLQEVEPDEWEVISLPCLYEEDGEIKALWPHKHTVEELHKLKEVNEVVFERQYMQNPKPKTGLMFPIEDLHFYNPYDRELREQLDDPDFIYLAADPANLGGDDFSALVAKLIEDRIYIDEVLYNTDGKDLNEPRIVEMVLRNKINHAGIEGVMGWAETVKRIRNELLRKGYRGEVRCLSPRTNKHTRIYNSSGFIKRNFYFRSDYKSMPQYDKFMRNLTSYLLVQQPGRENKHDEAPDNSQMVASYYEKTFPHLWENIEQLQK